MYSKPPDPEVQQLAEHLRILEKRHDFLTTDVTFLQVAMLIAQMQLALRHEGNNGISHKLTREILENWINTLNEASPGIGVILRRGFDPKFDTSMPRFRNDVTD